MDVKILAVTNRELAEEVAEGRFRQDLYYRLNVITLRTPTLRERPEDIPLLARHFLKNFAQQAGTASKSLSESALMQMQAYSWPGNIRELENRLMQADLMVEGPVIEWRDLKVSENTASTNARSGKTSHQNSPGTGRRNDYTGTGGFSA